MASHRRVVDDLTRTDDLPRQGFLLGLNVDVADQEELVLDDLRDEGAHDRRVLAEKFDPTNFFRGRFGTAVVCRLG